MTLRRDRTVSSCAVVVVMATLLMLDVADGSVLRGVPDEQRLLARISHNYDANVRPVYNATDSVVVTFGMSLIQLVDMVSLSHYTSCVVMGLDIRVVSNTFQKYCQ